MIEGLHLIVKGRVQGVGFRYFVYEKATALGVKGIVKNLFNGDVEVEAEAVRPLLEQFLLVVEAGPRGARVANIITEWKKAEKGFSTFEIR